LLTDTDRWQYVIFDARDVVTIQRIDGTQQDFLVQLNREKKTFSLWGTVDHEKKGNLSLQDPNPDQMILDGQVAGHRINARLQRVDLSDSSKFLLTNRGFHWVDPTMLLR